MFYWLICCLRSLLEKKTVEITMDTLNVKSGNSYPLRLVFKDKKGNIVAAPVGAYTWEALGVGDFGNIIVDAGDQSKAVFEPSTAGATGYLKVTIERAGYLPLVGRSKDLIVDAGDPETVEIIIDFPNVVSP